MHPHRDAYGVEIVGGKDIQIAIVPLIIHVIITG